jgi:hypothetical protein
VLGAVNYLFIVGRVEPLDTKRTDAVEQEAYARHT